jgi:hypothetical protein
MPGGDGTGPLGFGPMTGRSAGFCAGNSVAGYANPVAGRGHFFRRFSRSFFGRGRGYRNWFYATGLPGRGGINQGFYPNDFNASYSNITPEQEIDILINQSKYMEENMKAINERIKELEKSTKEK